MMEDILKELSFHLIEIFQSPGDPRIVDVLGYCAQVDAPVVLTCKRLVCCKDKVGLNLGCFPAKCRFPRTASFSLKTYVQRPPCDSRRQNLLGSR
uniref:Uncharacterized protein n=1 Tax=Romanomermis culicivorax TaxID=13658 RepID=A0A915JTE4_ROMCU